MRQRLLLAFALATSATLSAQDFFPLQVGNEWVYRATGSRAGYAALTIRVTAMENRAGVEYYRIEGYRTGSFWLRSTHDGKVMAYDPAKQDEKLWYNFRAPLREEFDTAQPGCCGRAAVLDRGARYAGRIGEGTGAVEVVYPGVRDFGITNEKFLPYIGMISRTEVTGGPAVAFYDLAYARVGGVTVLKEKTIDFGVALDNSVNEPSAAALVRLTLRNDTGTPFPMYFRDGQIFDVAIRDAAGQEVYRWSSDRGFTQALHTELIEAERQWVVFVPVPAQPGDYTLEAWLTATNATYRSSLALQVRR